MIESFYRSNKNKLVACGGVYAAYFFSLTITGSITFLDAVGCAAINTISLALLSLALWHFALRKSVELRGREAMFVHAASAIIFTMCWYWTLTVCLGVFFDRSVTRFSVSPFAGRAAVWQVVQGLTFYSLLAALAYLKRQVVAVAANLAAPAPEQTPAAPPFFYRDGEDFRPLDVDRIVFMKGADDYVEVATVTGTHLLRVTMAQLSGRVGATFLRVHRSWLVNSRRIVRAQPAGDGRMLLQMEDGTLITTSRAGARILREHMV